MDPEFIRGASYTKYGTTLYIGIGIPIPILNKNLVRNVAIKDEEIFTDIVDYGVPRRDRPRLGKVNYKELKSGKIDIQGKTVKVGSLSSLKKAKAVAKLLKTWIEQSTFYLSPSVEKLPTDTSFKTMKQTEEIKFVNSLVNPAVTCKETEDIKIVAKRIIDHSVNHIPVINDNNELKGIVTSWDITRAIAEGESKLRNIITKRVVTVSSDESIDSAARKLAQHHISALPVIDPNNKVLGIITSEDISKLLGR
jgi:CBS domain-containing protein